jgi:hypothetical protein
VDGEAVKYGLRFPCRERHVAMFPVKLSLVSQFPRKNGAA